MIQQLYNYADDNGGALKVPTYFILDEFANIGKIPDFDKKISTSRSRKISFSVILQNLDQLEAIYEKSYETIIGNCDTHLFLGSNSYKTVEYFSKALGEKTIERDSISVSRDKQYFRTGQSTSDQVMARALMTPDELRRMDNDLCIIFEKGIKPVKANKFYYFKHRDMVNSLDKVKVSHNDIEELDRGTWRKFNPYNPWVEDTTEKQAENLKVESLDDLFDETPAKKEEKPLATVVAININNSYVIKNNFFDFIMFFVSGIFEAIGSIIPGISGTALLMLFGTYDIIVYSIGNITNIRIIIPFVIGTIVTVILLVKVVDYLFRKHNNKMYAFILGMFISSVVLLIIQIFKTKVYISDLIIGIIFMICGIVISNVFDEK